MKDLEQLEKKNQNIFNNNKAATTAVKRKVGGVAPSTAEKKKPGINYEDRIRELEAKLFGK
jgi:hypothetical protein